MNTQEFKYTDGLVLRRVENNNDQISWFVAKDICDILSISNTSQATDRLDEDEKLLYKLYISGQERDTWIINESGLYSLILTSNKPESKEFKRWITHEVLPEIRRTGSFKSKIEKDKQDNIKRLFNDVERLDKEIKALKAQISDKNKLLKVKQTELNEILKNDITELSLF